MSPRWSARNRDRGSEPERRPLSLAARVAVGAARLAIAVALAGAETSASAGDPGPGPEAGVETQAQAQTEPEAEAQAGARAEAEAGRPPRPAASGRAAEEISVDRLCAAAVENALANPERARALVVRARLAGWLPEMGFRVYRRWARTEGVTLEDPVTGAPIPVDIKSIDDVRYEWRATWDLSRIVFNPDEISAHLEALRMADVRRDIQLMVIRLYFERRRLMSELAASAPPSPQHPAPPRDKSRLRVLEIEAELDALSGGALSDRAKNDHR
jgi:hypothetical protein